MDHESEIPTNKILKKIEVIVRTTDSDGKVDDTVFDMHPSGVHIHTERPISKRVDAGTNEVLELIPAKSTFVVITGQTAPAPG